MGSVDTVLFKCSTECTLQSIPLTLHILKCGQGFCLFWDRCTSSVCSGCVSERGGPILHLDKSLYLPPWNLRDNSTEILSSMVYQTQDSHHIGDAHIPSSLQRVWILSDAVRCAWMASASQNLTLLWIVYLLVLWHAIGVQGTLSGVYSSDLSLCRFM